MSVETKPKKPVKAPKKAPGWWQDFVVHVKQQAPEVPEAEVWCEQYWEDFTTQQDVKRDHFDAEQGSSSSKKRKKPDPVEKTVACLNQTLNEVEEDPEQMMMLQAHLQKMLPEVLPPFFGKADRKKIKHFLQLCAARPEDELCRKLQVWLKSLLVSNHTES